MTNPTKLCSRRSIRSRDWLVSESRCTTEISSVYSIFTADDVARDDVAQADDVAINDLSYDDVSLNKRENKI